MAKANINLPDGTKIVIDGSTVEINEILNRYLVPTPTEIENQELEINKSSNREKKKKIIKGPKLCILELKTEGFFNTKRDISAIQKKLEENGHIFPITHLSTPLKRLVQDKELGRLKENGGWVYYKR